MQMNDKTTIWWRLCPVAALLTVAGLFGFCAIKFEWIELSVWLTIPVYFATFLPNLYLTSFSLWHWRTRHRGAHPFGWALAFALFWAYLPALAYFWLHIDPDMRNRRQYSLGFSKPELPRYPQKYNILRSALFVVGGAMVFWGIFSSVTITVAHFVIFDVFDDTVMRHVGKGLTQGEVNALHISSFIHRLTMATAGISALAGSVGGLLLALSQRIRWRLLDQKEKESLQQGRCTLSSKGAPSVEA